MRFTELRNAVVAGLSDFLEVPVVPVNEVNGLPEVPYAYYSITSQREARHAFGLLSFDGEVQTRAEQVSATFSFTFCSENRGEGEEEVFGRDEAMDLAEKATGWFLMQGRRINNGEAVATDVGTVRERSGFQTDAYIYRYGFDVTYSYVRTDSAPMGRIDQISIKKITE